MMSGDSPGGRRGDEQLLGGSDRHLPQDDPGGLLRIKRLVLLLQIFDESQADGRSYEEQMGGVMKSKLADLETGYKLIFRRTFEDLEV